MAKLQILAEVQRLSHDDVAVSLEHHHGNRVTGLQIADDELGEYVQPELNVRQTLDYT